MKVFFVKKKSKAMGRILGSVCVILTLTLIVSQWHILSGKSSAVVSAVPENEKIGNDIISITPPFGIKDGEAFIYVNGDEYAPFYKDEVFVTVYPNTVIEILNYTKNDFEVSADDSQCSLSVIYATDKLICTQGINFLCRVISKE